MSGHQTSTTQKSSPKAKPAKKAPASPLVLRLGLAAIKWGVIAVISLIICGLAVGAIAYAIAYPKLPDVHLLAEYQPKLPLRIYSADGILIGEYSEERREFMPISEIPLVMRNAVLAVEDANFYNHPGIDYKGLARAVLGQVLNKDAGGASTITMQVARNFYLSSERKYIRKFYEILLSFRIENNLTKDQILEIYMNQIFLGHRSYGFAAAAQTYFGKKLQDITLAEAAMLAGLPQSPSRNNPISDFNAARQRQMHVLRRMLEVRWITQEQYDQAVAETIVLRKPAPPTLHAEFAADAVQQMILDQFGADAYTNGLNVYTTIQGNDQKSAYRAVRQGLLAYERRQFYRGPEGYIDLPQDPQALIQTVASTLEQHPDNEELMTAIVLSADPKKVTVTRDGQHVIEITGAGLEPVKSGLAANARPEVQIKPGSIIRIVQTGESSWDITQIPEVEGALVAMDPQTGAIRALVGGFDFARKKYNHVTQAWRQPGSSFKPFVYSAALERGVTANTTLNDAPIMVRNPGGRGVWTPKNYGSSFAGRVPMWEALARSRNIPAILVLDAISPQYAQQWIGHFGFEPSKHPPYLTMVLGAGSVTPLQMASAYSIFANGGYQVDPYLVTRVTDAKGNILLDYTPPALSEQRRVIPARNAFVMNTLLNGVVTRGSGAAANRALRRSDIYGKTGTTNDSRDAWFVGYTPTLAAAVWVGYDTPKDLGRRENGGFLALPIWVSYMKDALEGVPQKPFRPVAGVTNVNGQWVYDEFAYSGGIKSLGDELTPNPEDIPIVNDEHRDTILDMFR
ncbi:penicillin-binding protein 1A [Saezia sanguinis]|uniref:penicillin-binding protein 1A n=1 Tax=Saezia sanguinis TaxID=1965230 RepID=UPI00306340C6